MIKRAHIRQFLAVVDEGSFTQAAVRLRVTQPTLSTGVADLERLVGTPLFLRERRKLRLTEAGGRFLPIARDLERGFQAADGFGAAAIGDWPELKIGVLRSIAGPMFEALMAALVKEFSIEIVEGGDAELRTAVSSGRAHLALTLLRDRETGDQIIPLLDEPYVMLARRDHPLAGRDMVLPEELGAEIMIARRSCELLEATSRFFSHHGVRPRFALRSDSDDRCMRMVAAGLGITTAPLSLASHGLAVLPVQGYDFRRRIGLIGEGDWMKRWSSAEKIRSIVDRIAGKYPRYSQSA